MTHALLRHQILRGITGYSFPAVPRINKPYCNRANGKHLQLHNQKDRAWPVATTNACVCVSVYPGSGNSE